MPTASDVLGQEYRLIEKIGEGGMGTVWLAHDVVLHREVAIKLLHETLLRDPKANARFRNEARAAARLRHPNICGLIDVGEHQGTPFLVMPRLRGESLSSRMLREGRLSAFDAVEIAMAVLRALYAAHTANILHRDLKPANVFLTLEEGGVVPKILDFGASKFMAVDVEPLTRTGVVVGTPAYMSPEQAQGARVVDVRADVWGAGLLLYEMLAGRLPHDAANAHAMIIRVGTQEPRPISELLPTLDRELAKIVMRALAFRPADRYPTARNFLVALRDWQQRATPAAGARPSTGTFSTGPAQSLSPGSAVGASATPAAPFASIPPSPPPGAAYSAGRVSPTSDRPPRYSSPSLHTPSDTLVTPGPPSFGTEPTSAVTPSSGYRTSVAPAMVRAAPVQKLLAALMRARGGEQAVAAMRPATVKQIETARADDWLRVSLPIELTERALPILGERGLRALIARATAQGIDDAFRRELPAGANPFASFTPMALLLRLPSSWNVQANAAGAVRIEPRPVPIEATIVWDSVPVECHGRDSVATVFAGILEGIFQVLEAPATVSMAERDPVRGVIKCVASWGRL